MYIYIYIYIYIIICCISSIVFYPEDNTVKWTVLKPDPQMPGKKLAVSEVPSEAKQGKQKGWDSVVTKKISKELINSTSRPLDQAQMRAAATPYADDWHHPSPQWNCKCQTKPLELPRK